MLFFIVTGIVMLNRNKARKNNRMKFVSKIDSTVELKKPMCVKLVQVISGVGCPGFDGLGVSNKMWFSDS